MTYRNPDEHGRPWVAGRARYAKGKVSIRPEDSSQGLKGRVSRLLGHLKAKWSNRESAYITTPTKLAKLERLWDEGRDASTITGQLYEERPNPMTDHVTLTETYKTGKGAGIIVAESGKVRGPYKVTVLVGDREPKTRKVKRLGEARAALRGKLGPLRKAANPNEVIRLVLGEGERATVSESVANPLNKYYFQRGTGGLIRRKGRPHWVGSLGRARDEARRLSKMGRGVKVTILRVEPDGDQTMVGTVGNPQRMPNPNMGMDDADRLYENFHGRAPTQTTRVVTRTKARTDLAELGPLTELKVHLLTGKRIKLPYEVDCADQVMLCSSPDGRQLYFVGGDQTIDLRRLGMAGREWVKDSMVLGVLEMVTYRTEKGFDKFKLTDYYHELGEESGMQPLLVYDNINGLLSVAGGQYEVRPEGIVN